MPRGELHPALVATADRYHGVFLRGEALAAGYSPDEIRSQTAGGGPWTVVRRGAYLLTDRWAAATSDEQTWWRDVAAHRTMRLAHLMSHDSAAHGLGVPMLHPRAPLSHVTRRGVGGSRTRYGVKHHLGRELPADVALVNGIPMTGLARTALDLGREHGFSAGVIAIDHVLRRGVPLRAFERELARMTSWPYVRICRRALAFADPGAESVGESLTRMLLAELGWGPLETQFPVPAGDGARWCDLRAGRHIVEFDGFGKYRPRADGGFADVDPSLVAFRDRQRDTDIGQLGLGISHVTWRDLFAGREAAKVRLRREEALTVSRFGRELPAQLVEFARRNPRVVPPAGAA